MKHWQTVSLTAVMVSLLAGLLLLSGAGHGRTSAQGTSMALDLNLDGGPCADIDSSASNVTGAHQVAVCLQNLPAAAFGVGAFSFDLVYNDSLNRCVDEVCASGPCLDDNPDVNAGTTRWGDGLGGATSGDWSCLITGGQEPLCDADLGEGEGHGVAKVNCLAANGPYTMGDDETSGVLAVVDFQVIAGGTDNLSLRNVNITGEDFATWLRCSPGTGTCTGGTVDKSGGAPLPTSTATATQTVRATPSCGLPDQPTCTPIPKAWTQTPTATTPPEGTPPPEQPTAPPPPPPPPPPSGQPQPIVQPPPTGSGPNNAIPSTFILAGAAAAVAGLTSVGLGVVCLRRTRAR